MALNTYSALQAHLASDLNRSDLTSTLPDMIRLAEAEMSERLKCREMDFSDTLTITGGEATIPAGLQSVRSMRLADSPYSRIQPEGLDQLEARRPDVGGPAQTYSMTAESFLFWPPSDGSARITYRRDVPALTTDNPSNWVLAEHPQLYLYGALWQTYLFLKDDARAASYEQKFGAAIQALNERNIVSQLPGMQVSPLVRPV